MSKQLLWIDDDINSMSLQPYIHEFIENGWEILAAPSIEEAEEILKLNGDTIKCIITDIMMPSPQSMNFSAKGGHETGFIFSKWIKKNYPLIPVICLSIAGNEIIKEWFEQNKYVYLSKRRELPDTLLEKVESLVSGIKNYKIFIVHGHDEGLKYELKDFIQNELKIGKPIILHEQPSHGRTIIEKFEKVTNSIDLVFVLLTPDDNAKAVNDIDYKVRARQNVIFEMGYFMGKLSRTSSIIYLLFKGNLEIPSDISGLIYFDITNGLSSVKEQLRIELERYL